MKKGKVYLVGAGPGDTGLITVKGLDCLKKADVVVHDCIIEDSLLAEIPAGTRKIDAGKSAKRHLLEQEDINRLLVDLANQGKKVVRLKGGDPFVLGRGGEEAEFLASNGIPFEIVPGVSSAVAVPAYAGIPVTHRRLASSLAVLSGHESADKDESTIAWDKISTGSDTLVILMTVRNLRTVVDRLIANGRSPSTPVAVITDGTVPRQRTVVGQLGNIVSRAEEAKVQSPSIMVVGEVVGLREHIRWYDSHSLFGKRVLITRPETAASQMGHRLIECGATPVEIPVIAIQLVLSTDELDRAILDLKDYHWVIFTSANGVESFFRRLDFLGKDARWLSHIRIGAIGSATAEALVGRGLRADLMPGKYTSRSLLARLQQEDMSGCRVLLPRADIAGEKLGRGLSRFGAEVHEIAAYRTVPNTRGMSLAKKMIAAGEIDIVTFTSSSAVIALVKALGGRQKALDKVIIACIGPVTAAAAAKAGLRVDIVARKHTVDGLLEAMEEHFLMRKKNERIS